ncbi:Kinesin-like protein KCA2 [Capsicum chinense]|nr:Kinesin-like protein KCA2 [Capsicum chinense]
MVLFINIRDLYKGTVTSWDKMLAGELQCQIRNWLAENFDFLFVTDETVGGATGQLELLSTAIMDGWMDELGATMPPSTDVLGQLLSEYAKRVYNSELQHLKILPSSTHILFNNIPSVCSFMGVLSAYPHLQHRFDDIAETLSTEVAEDSGHVAKLRTALEAVDTKRRKILQQTRSDMEIWTLDDGSSPVRNPSTAAEDARLASLASLDGILKIDVMRQFSVNTLGKSRKKAMLAFLDELAERMPSLLDIDHPYAQRHIEEARHAVESSDQTKGGRKPAITDTRPAVADQSIRFSIEYCSGTPRENT